MFKITGHKIYSKQEVLVKLQKYCAYQERSELQVAMKCKQYAMTEVETSEIIEALKQSKFLDQVRFSKAFVDGKFKTKGWGKQKIKQGLKLAGVSGIDITNSIQGLNSVDYLLKLETLAQKKWQTIKSEDDFEKRNKLIRFLLGKGYEMDDVMNAIKKINP